MMNIIMWVFCLLAAFVKAQGFNAYDLSTVPGYAQLVNCAQQALSSAVNPLWNFEPNCQSNDPPKTYASCMCGNNGYSEVTSFLDDYHSGCSTVTPFDALSVFRNFCSVNAGQLAPIGAATSADPGGPITGSAMPGDTVMTSFASATSTPTNSQQSSSFSQPSSDGDLSTGADLGIGIGAVVIFLLIVGVGLYFCCRGYRNRFRNRFRNRKKKPRSHDGPPINNDPTVLGWNDGHGTRTTTEASGEELMER